MQNNKMIHRIGGTHNKNHRERLKGVMQSKMGSLQRLGGRFQINFFLSLTFKKGGKNT